jgi:ABC-2 type transport system permease protein
MTRSVYLGVMLVVLILGFVGLNWTARSHLDGVRLDLTERGLYQLSPGTRQVLDRLDEPVQLDFYFSRREAAQYPAIRAYGVRVREMLRAVGAEAGGGVRLSEIDPDPFSTEEDAAIAAGLQPIPTDEGGQIFFGLVGRNAVDERRVIALFDPNNEARLEYEILRAIAELERARTPHIAILSDLPFAPDLDGQSANPIINELARTYQISWLERDFGAIPADADALFLLHAAPLSEAQTYAVDQFALTRGRVLALIDPMAHVALKPGPDGLPPINAERASSLGPLLARWGVSYDLNTVVMDADAGLPVQIVEAGRTRMRAYPLWFTVQPAGLNTELPATLSLSLGINLGSPGELVPLEQSLGANSALSFTPLLSTTAIAGRLDADIAASSPPPETLLRDFDPAEDAPLVVGARISGRFDTAFPDGPPETALANPADHVSQSAGAGEVIVIADADLLDPAFYLSGDGLGGEQLAADNPTLILNLADRLAGDRALVGLRSRASSARPMTRVEALRSDAEARYRSLQDELQARLVDAETRLATLNAAGRASALGGASDADQAEAAVLRAEILDARERLREIERGFRVEIDALEESLMLWTIWIPPLGVVLMAGLIALFRRRVRA